MLITKFNKMIRNKVIWGGIAVAVSIMMIGFLGPKSGCGAQSGPVNAEGTLYGDEVTPREFMMARFYELGLRDNVPLTPEDNRRLRGRVWRRLAAMHTAGDLGVLTTDGEMGETIRNDPTFAINGVFDPDRYRTVIEGQLRVGVEVFEDFLRQSLTLRKLTGVMESLVWIPPSEVERRLRNLTDTVVVEYAVVGAADPESVRPSDEDLRMFFDENKDMFSVPEKVRVRYVAFPVADHAGGDDDEVDYARILEYYNDHIDDYMSGATNEEAQPVPVETVRDDIAGKLAHEDSVFRARDSAMQFVMALAQDRYGNAADLAETAAAAGLPIQTSEYFTVNEPVPGLAAGLAFNESAFALDANDPERYFSDPVIGDEAVFVLIAQDRIEAHDPEFEIVREDVIAPATSNAVRLAAMERAVEVRDAAVASLADGTGFAGAVASFGLNVVTTSPFSVYIGMASNEQEYASAIVPTVITLVKGDVSEPLGVPDGALLVYLAGRSTGDFTLVQGLRPQLLTTVNQYRASRLFEDWTEYLLREAEHRDLRPPLDMEASEEPAEDS